MLNALVPWCRNSLLESGSPMHTNTNVSVLVEASRIPVKSGAGTVGPEGPLGAKTAPG